MKQDFDKKKQKEYLKGRNKNKITARRNRKEILTRRSRGKKLA